MEWGGRWEEVQEGGDICIPMADMDFLGGSDGNASTYNAGDPVRPLGQKDSLEKEMVTHSSILAWRIP